MNDAPERSGPEQEPAAAPYVRLPMPLVALALFVFLAVLLGIGLWANRNLRPQGIVVPTPVTEASATAVPPVAVPATSTAPPSAPPTAAVAATATTAPTPLILTMASPTPSPPPPTLAPSATPIPAATESPTPLPTVEPTLAAEVGKAYENFWHVRSQAELTLDSSHLPEVMNGSYLENFVEVLGQLKEEGKAIKVQVVLNYTVIQAADESAIIHDRIEDSSFYVQLGTNAALSDPTNDLLRIEFTLKRLEGQWKVVDSVREN